MPSYTVVAAQEVRRLPEKDGQPPRAVVHLTLSGGGVERLVTMFPKVSDPLPDVGSTIEGELGDPDSFDKDRRKFNRPRSGGGGGGGFRKRDPAETRAIQRQHSQHMALLYVQIKAEKGWIEGFDFADVAKMADAFDRDLDPTPPAEPEYPGDDDGLPPARDLG